MICKIRSFVALWGAEPVAGFPQGSTTPFEQFCSTPAAPQSHALITPIQHRVA
jgi:hypothetical protein